MLGSDITLILSSARATKNFYRGTFTIEGIGYCEKYIDLNNKNILVIHSKNHWLLVYLNLKSTEKYCCFIDSLGRKPEFYGQELQNMLLYFDPKYHYLPYPIQAHGSDYCGYFVIFFAVSLCQTASLARICKPFKKGMFRENIDYLKLWFENTFRDTNLYTKINM